MAPPYKLISIDGSIEHALDAPELIVGRDADCGIRLDDQNTSRHHARMTADGGAITVEDLGSTNGTYVNNREISSPKLIKDGDVIRFGVAAFYLALPSHESQTIIESKLGDTGEAESESMVVIDPEDKTETVFRQSYPLPAGWPSQDDDSMFSAPDAPAAEQFRQMIDAGLSSPDEYQAALLVLNGPQQGTVIGLKSSGRGQWVIGRDEVCDVTLTDVSVSANHATLIVAGGSWGVHDNKSTNGTQVNGVTQRVGRLSDGSVVTFGKLRVAFRLFDPAR